MWLARKAVGATFIFVHSDMRDLRGSVSASFPWCIYYEMEADVCSPRAVLTESVYLVWSREV